MALLQLQRARLGSTPTPSNVCSSNRVRSVVVRAGQRAGVDTEAPNLGAAFLAATAAASMLVGADMIVPGEATAASSGGRAGASKFSARRRGINSDPGPSQVNSYSSTTIIAAPPVLAPPVVVAPPPPFGISIVPVIPIPLPNPFASPAPAPVAASTVAAEAAAASASAEAAAAAATAAAAAATAAAAVAAAN